MNSSAARTSSSDRDGLPPLGGIAPLPFSADCTRPSVPCMSWGAPPAWCPGFGARATPLARRHRADTLDGFANQIVQSFLDERYPGRLVADLRRAGDAGLVAVRANRLI